MWGAGHGAAPGRVVWQKLATATVSLRSLCHGAAWAWLDGAWGGAAGQWMSDGSITGLWANASNVNHLSSPLSCRVLLDRAHTDYNSVFHGLDPEMLDLPLSPCPSPAMTPRLPATNKFASTSETNTSDRSSSFSSPASSPPPSSTDLSQILLNIKSCRWRHFRPRTLPLHELDNAHPLFRRLSRGLKNPVSAPTSGGQPSHRLGRVIPPPAPTAGQ